VELNPLVPEEATDYFCLDGVRYHDFNLTILYDKTGKRYGKGAGVHVFADGEEIGSSPRLQWFRAKLPSVVEYTEAVMDEIPSKHDAQQRVNRIRTFRQELAEVEKEGVLALSPEQRRALETHHSQTLESLARRFDVDITESEKQISWGMRIASTIGGLALCAAVFLFFYRFWGVISTPVQVALLAATPIACVLATDFAARRERTLYFTSLIGIVAFAAFVLDLNVLGNIFNMTPSPMAFLVWGAFGLCLAYAYRLRLPLLAGLVCLLLYLPLQILSWMGAEWRSDQRPEAYLLSGLMLVAAPAVIQHRKQAEFPPVYRLLGLLVLFLGLFILSLNGRLSFLPFGEKPVEALYQVAGFAAASVAIWRGIKAHWTGVVNLGAAFLVIYLYSRLFRWWWDWMPKYLLFLIIGLISIGLLLLFKRVRGHWKEVAA
jgi:uncharacterized membrane protein